MQRLKSIALAALFFAPLAALIWQNFAPPPQKTLTDGLGISLPATSTTARTVVWTDPEPATGTPPDSALSPDGNTRVTAAERIGGQGGLDLYISHRSAEGTWSEPKNLGLSVNTGADEHSPAFSPSANRLYFTSDRSGNFDIHATELDPDFKPAASYPVPDVNSPGGDLSPAIAPHGDFLYFSSDRHGNFDLYRSRLLHGEILPPENLGAPVNSSADETHPFPSPDGLSLTFRAADNYVTSTSREVTTIAGGSPLLATLRQHWRWIAVSLGALIIAVLVIRRYFGEHASLTEKCLAGSVALHLALLFLFATWKFAAHVIELEQKEKIEVALNSDNLAEEKLALDIRESVAVLPEVQVQTAPALTSPPPPPPTDTQAAVAAPPQTPADLAFATPAPAPLTATFTPATPSLPDLPSPSITPAPPAPVPLPLEAPPAQDAPEPAAPLAELTAPPSPPLPGAPSVAPDLQLPTAEPTPHTPAPAEAPKTTTAPAPVSADFAPPPSDLPAIAAPSTQGAAIKSPSPVQLRLEQPSQPRAPAPQPDLASLDPATTAPSPLALPTTPDSSPLAHAPPLPPKPSSPLPPTPTPATAPPAALPPLSPALELPGSTPLPALPELPSGSALALESPEPIDNPYLLRDPDVRARVIEQLGGSNETEKAIRASLDWLTRHQEKDGRWDIRRHGGRHGHDVAATSFALLCYMGWGATHQKDTPHKNTVARALDWLLSKVDPETGDARDGRGDMYEQGVAAIALAEAYALTEDPKILEPLTAAVKFIVAAQSPRSGGWRYVPGDHNGDTSVVGWQLLALASARSAGVDVPQSAFGGARRWLDKVGGGQFGGHYGYQDRSPRAAMVAEGMFCQQLLDLPPTHPRMAESASYVTRNFNPARETNYYFWYYGALAMFQHGGSHWGTWNSTLTPVLLATQEQRGKNAGSWRPAGHHGNDAGRAVVTAMATLTLEVYYRYLPMYSSPSR